MKTTFIITSVILSCSLLTACGGGGNSSKTHSTTTSETTEVVSVTTSGTPGLSGNNSDEVTATIGSVGNNSTDDTGITVADEGAPLSCSPLSACGGGGGNSNKTPSTTTSEIPQEGSIATSGIPGSSGNNSGEVTETVGSVGSNPSGNTEISVVNEATLQNKPVISTSANEARISEAEYNTGTILTRTVNDTDSTMLHKSNVVNEPEAYALRMKDGEVAVDIKPIYTGDPADYRELVSQKLNILRDTNGDAVGFYGIVETHTSETVRNLSGKEKYGRMDYIVAMNGEEKRLPSVTADYAGKLYYDQEQAPGKEADISLRYEERQISGTIIDKERPHFSLKIDTREPHEVDEDGSFMAVLVGTNDRTDQTMHGYIDGGFYGKDGEIVAGSVRSKDDDSWGGVFGGKKEE